MLLFIATGQIPEQRETTSSGTIFHTFYSHGIGFEGLATTPMVSWFRAIAIASRLRRSIYSRSSDTHALRMTTTNNSISTASHCGTPNIHNWIGGKQYFYILAASTIYTRLVFQYTIRPQRWLEHRTVVDEEQDVQHL